MSCFGVSYVASNNNIYNRTVFDQMYQQLKFHVANHIEVASQFLM